MALFPRFLYFGEKPSPLAPLPKRARGIVWDRCRGFSFLRLQRFIDIIIALLLLYKGGGINHHRINSDFGEADSFQDSRLICEKGLTFL
jgi:hypothetical protein